METTKVMVGKEAQEEVSEKKINGELQQVEEMEQSESEDDEEPCSGESCAEDQGAFEPLRLTSTCFGDNNTNNKNGAILGKMARHEMKSEEDKTGSFKAPPRRRVYGF